jgi:hypothetical protein
MAVFHPIGADDKTAMAAMRAIVEPSKGRLQGTAARGPFDAIMEHVAVPEGVTFEAGAVGGIPGWWCRPEAARPGAALLHIHGGWFNWGSAKAYRNLVGHLAMHASAVAFAPDYRLAPERPFPAAAEDVRASYFGLTDLGYRTIAVTAGPREFAIATSIFSRAKMRASAAPTCPEPVQEANTEVGAPVSCIQESGCTDNQIETRERGHFHLSSNRRTA